MPLLLISHTHCHTQNGSNQGPVFSTFKSQFKQKDPKDHTLCETPLSVYLCYSTPTDRACVSLPGVPFNFLHLTFKSQLKKKRETPKDHTQCETQLSVYLCYSTPTDRAHVSSPGVPFNFLQLTVLHQWWGLQRSLELSMQWRRWANATGKTQHCFHTGELQAGSALHEQVGSNNMQAQEEKTRKKRRDLITFLKIKRGNTLLTYTHWRHHWKTIMLLFLSNAHVTLNVGWGHR